VNVVDGLGWSGPAGKICPLLEHGSTEHPLKSAVGISPGVLEHMADMEALGRGLGKLDQIAEESPGV
jgi:hypothetical protein